MEPDKNTPEAESPNTDQAAPADALSRTPDDLGQEQAATAAANAAANPQPETPGVKQPSALKRFLRKVNLYLLLFVLLAVISGIIVIVSYLNSQKEAPQPNIQNQALTQEALKQLANTDASVGNTSQTLNIQGNTIIAGQTLMRGNLNVAGNFQTGGSIQGPSLTISGETNLGNTQINTLQVATNTAIQGSTTLRDLNVAGTSSFSGPMTASQITTSRLIMSGNAVLQIPNHISFTGPSPSRVVTSANSSVLGAGGTVSVNGSDTTGTININTGNNPSAGCFTRINFSQAFTTAPHVIISPVGSAAGALDYYVDRDRNGFNLCSNNAAAAGRTFAFDYFVTG